METKWFGLANLLFFSLTASAFPHVSLNQLVQKSDSECNQISDDNGWRDLIQQVNLIPKRNAKGELTDGRGVLSAKAPELGLSANSIAQIKKTVGDIFCPNLSSASQGTAFLVGEGGQIVTNAHVFLEENGEDRERLSNCFFQNKEVPFQRVPLEVTAKTFRLFTRATKSEYFKDLAVVRLKRKIPEARPFRIELGNSLREGDQIIMISAFQLKLPSLPKKSELIAVAPGRAFTFEYLSEPIVEACTVMKIQPEFVSDPINGIFNNCSSTHGASGSPVFVIRNGELVVKAVNAYGGNEGADGTPFSLEKGTPRGKSFSYAIEINREISDQIEAFEAANEK